MRNNYIYKKYLYKNNRGLLWTTIITIIIMTLMNVYVSLIIQELIDMAGGEKETVVLFHFIEKLLLYILVLFFISYLHYKIKNIYIYRVVKGYKEELFHRIIKKEIKSFKQYHTSEYVSALSNDILIAENDYIKAIFKILENIISLIGGIAIVIYLNIYVFLGAIILFIIPLSITNIFGNKLEVKQSKVSQSSMDFISCLQDIFSGFSDIKLFKAEERISEVYKKSNKNFENAKKIRNDIEEKTLLFSSVSGSIFLIGVCAICVMLAMKSVISIGSVVACIQAVNYIVAPVQQLPPAFGKVNASKLLLEKLEILTDEHQDNITEQRKKIKNLSKKIELDRVSVQYVPGQPVIKNLSVTFEQGKSYAIVGASGSGKSTLLNLILGTFDQYSGNIYIDGCELRNIDSQSLYKLISVIQQKVFIFNGSIKENITMYNDFDDEVLSRTVQMAGITDFVSEKGLDYNCGENGSNLSGGERQRISIARSILQSKPVLFMDEATSSLDAKTTYEVENTILEMKGVMRIVITHKLDENILRKYDQILVIKNGMIAEIGTYDELIKRKAEFYALKLVSS